MCVFSCHSWLLDMAERAVEAPACLGYDANAYQRVASACRSARAISCSACRVAVASARTMARTWHGVVRRTTVLSVHPSIEHFVVCIKRNVYVIHFRIHATVACVKYTQDSVKDGRTVCFTSRILHSRVRRRDSSGPRVPGTVQPYRTARRQRGFGSRSGSTVRARARCRMAMVRMTVERAEARRGCERRR